MKKIFITLYTLLNKTAGFVFLFLLFIQLLSCKKFVEVAPPNTATSSKMVFKNDITANAAILGIYSRMNQFGGGAITGTNSITFLCGLSSDELTNQTSSNLNQLEFFNNQINATNTTVLSTWSELYNYIYAANVILEGLSASTEVSKTMKKDLEGEAYFIRAFCHFYLVNLYGDVPIVSSSDYRINSVIYRSPAKQVYAFIIDDLIKAKELLDANYVSAERTRVNKAAATAFLARVYLYNEDWEKAELEASQVIDNPTYAVESNLRNVFLIASKEAIWQLQSVVPRYSTFDGRNFILTATPTSVSLNTEFLKSASPVDARIINWVGQIKPGLITYYYPFKYKVRLGAIGSSPTEYLMMLRLAEQYLIRAEVRARQNNISGAQTDLNVIRKRANLNNTLADNQETMLLAIEEERKIELFTEWGHRWFDLKRTGRIDMVLGLVKPNWTPSSAYFPIPSLEKQKNPNLNR